MPVEMELSAAALALTVDRLRRIVPNLGSVFFVDCDAGVDAPGRGTYALPLRTIDYGVSNYAVAWRNDVFICWGSAGGGFNENVNADGIQLDVASTVVCAYNNVRVDNTNAGATSLFHILAPECWILGFTIQPTVATLGILDGAGGTRAKIGYDESFYNIFSGCAEDVRLQGSGSKAYFNKHEISQIGYNMQTTYCQIKNNDMRSPGGAGTMGITSTGAGDNNFIRDNIVMGFETGINLVAGATGNILVENSLFCTVNIADANGVLVNGWIHNKSRSLISHTNTVQQDLKDIFDLGGGGPGPGPGPAPREVGDVFFVSTTGSNANGDGSLGDPWATIDFAVGNCVAHHNDMIVAWSPNGAFLNENANAAGVLLDVAGVSVVGINLPAVQNTNGGAASVFSARADDIAIEGFRLDVTNVPQIVSDGVAHSNLYIADNRFGTGISNIYITLIDGGEIYNNYFRYDGNFGIRMADCDDIDIHDNELTSAGGVATAIEVSDVAGGIGSVRCSVYRNRITGNAGGTGISIGSFLSALNSVTSNWITGCQYPVVDASTSNTWSDNHIDTTNFDHIVTVAHGVIERTVVSMPDGFHARSGWVEFNVDVSDLDTNEIGKTVLIRLYDGVVAAGAELAREWHVCGVDPDKPRIAAMQRSGGGVGAYNLTVQMNAVVAAPRTIRFAKEQE